ncbi:MAG: type I secretion system permease/ATPase [Magnetococcales bacterium]|nr:type I secretion system permease/ATPase [Magnetococcales bacterium]
MVIEEKTVRDDPLAQCLVILARQWQRPISLEAIYAGLPLTDGRLTPELFIRAAERVDLSARLVRQSLSAIQPSLLPAVLLLDQDQAVILVDLDRDKGEAALILPETGGGGEVVPLSSLQQRYSGYTLFIRPLFQFDGREQQPDDDSPRSWFWGTLSRFWLIYGEVALASLLLNLFTLANSLFVMNVYDRVVPNHAYETLWALAIGVMLVYGFDFILRTLRGYFLDVAGKKADILMANSLFAQIMGLRMVAQPTSSGVMARQMQEFETLRDFFTSASLTTLIDLPFIGLFLLVIGYLGGPVVWVPLAAVPLVVAAGLLAQMPLSRVVQRSFKESSQKHAVLIEAIAGLETVKANRAEGVMQRQWEDCVAAMAQSGLSARFISMVTLHFSILVQQLTTVGMVIVGVYQIGAGTMTTGALIACTLLGGRAIAPLSQLAALLVRLQQSVVSLRALNRVMSLPIERPRNVSFLQRPRLAGSITLDQVAFRYPGQESDTLNGVTIHIRAGERVALIGRTGSGKSTLLKVILGFYQPNSGSVLFDGIDARQIDPVDLRRDMGCVLQDPLLFYGTLRFNIALGKPFAEDDEILQAARLAGVDDFAYRDPRGFDRMIGEQGRGLSGGQRQMVAMARALLGHPSLLLLDEPTSSMDTASEDRFRERLTGLLPGRTLILVTHKTSLLSLVDRIILVESGKVVADGPKQQILAMLK